MMLYLVLFQQNLSICFELNTIIGDHMMGQSVPTDYVLFNKPCHKPTVVYDSASTHLEK